jgi:hypothetical protein
MFKRAYWTKTLRENTQLEKTFYLQIPFPLQELEEELAI